MFDTSILYFQGVEHYKNGDKIWSLLTITVMFMPTEFTFIESLTNFILFKIGHKNEDYSEDKENPEMMAWKRPVIIFGLKHLPFLQVIG